MRFEPYCYKRYLHRIRTRPPLELSYRITQVGGGKVSKSYSQGAKKRGELNES